MRDPAPQHRDDRLGEQALIVAAIYGAIAGVLALTGKNKVQAGTPPVPKQTVDSVKEDVGSTKEPAKEGRA